ncbi:MAG: PAS domain S-box protein [Oligoflexia bacterium]|nr:PAS domain S-box protein [Oligoflexia bacterium]
MRTAKGRAAAAASRKAKLIPLRGGAGAPAEAPESKYEAIFNQSSDAILTILPDGRIDAANQAVEEVTGFLKGELSGAMIDVLVPDPSKHLHRARPLTRELLASAGTFEDIAILRKDGYVRFVDLHVRRVMSGQEPLTLALLRDVTGKKSMERELITKHSELRNAYFQLEKKNAELQAMQETLVQSGKLAALGELAAGIAHELNQPLQGIRGYAQEIQHHFSAAAAASPEIEAGLREIVSNVDKMAGIIGYLRAFVRKSVEEYAWADLHLAIEESLKMLGRQFAVRGIAVERDFGKDVPPIYANALQLEQVFINLATNARDAIEATGRGRGTVWISTRFKNGFVEIDFRDDGCGMNERSKAKAFNPFFTTKEVGKGMGLGLSLSYGILSKLNGSIVVQSELGKGAAFRIRIPRDFREIG